MFCFQCQETAKNAACTVRGVCGKSQETANLQDLLIYVCKGIAVYADPLRKRGVIDEDAAKFIREALFTTVTNVAWDNEAIIDRVQEGLRIKDAVKERAGEDVFEELPDCATWTSMDREEIMAKALSEEVRITATENEDARSLRELLIIGCKGIAALRARIDRFSF